MVDRPDEASAIAILRGLKERYESHHHVRIRDEAIIAAVQLSGATSPTVSCPTGHRPHRRGRLEAFKLEIDSVP